MDFHTAMTHYMTCRRDLDLVESEFADRTAPIKAKMQLLSDWMAAKAQQEGLKNVPVVGLGTGYFTTKMSASVANPEEFWKFVKEKQRYDLVETRAASKAVKDFIEETNTPVPGVTFAQTQVFKIRAPTQSDKE